MPHPHTGDIPLVPPQHHNYCNIAIAITSTLPHPHTGDIPSVPPQHHNYCTNPVATTTAATSPFVGMPTTCCIHPYTCHGHTQATPLPSPLLCLVHPKKPQISHFPFYFPLSLMVQDISPQHRPVAPPMACKHPPHLPSCTCRLPLHCHHHHNNHHLNASTTSTTSPTPSPYNWRHLTFPHRQGVKKVHWPSPFLQHPHLLTLPLCVGHPTCVAAPIVPPRLCVPLHTHALHLCMHARGCRRDSMPTPVPSSLAMPSPLPPVYAPCPAHMPSPFACMVGVQEGLGRMCMRGGERTRGDAHKGNGCTQGEGKGAGGCMQGEGPHTRGGRGTSEQVSGAVHEQKEVCTLSTPPAPSRST